MSNHLPGRTEYSEIEFSTSDYRKFLSSFDAATCEAIAISQATAGRLEKPAIGFSTRVYGRVCSHASSMICAAPLSRWVRKDFEIWDVSSVASHARSILEGYLLFFYLSNAPDDPDAQSAYILVMHLYDCCKRISILPYVLPSSEIEDLKRQADEIKGNLSANAFFKNLDAKQKKDLLSGKYLMITPKTEIISASGIEQERFNFFWNYLSQYTHIFSFSFYRMESNGRGTGIKNSFDQGTLCLTLAFCTDILNSATDKMLELFPDAANVRRGADSKFAPGPSRNMPKELKRIQRSRRFR